jgi:hypothetical protein
MLEVEVRTPTADLVEIVDVWMHNKPFLLAVHRSSSLGIAALEITPNGLARGFLGPFLDRSVDRDDRL